MPLVRQSVPDAELRIFGARPTAAVRALDTEPGVTIVGEVDDYDDEFRRAGVSLAPAMVDAGLLMKAIRAMAMGCPVVLNSASAGPIVGLTPGMHALVGDSTGELATRVVELMQDSAKARKLGEAGKGLVRAHFSWDRTAAVYRDAFNRLLLD
jgi:glycosyltransferase involved in cell wall biosynthesis